MAISSDSERTKFVKSIRSIIELYGLDGVDIDWEFPAWPPLKSPISERYDFVELLQWSANYWANLGVPKRKIMVGIPTYGKKFILLSKRSNEPFSLAIRSTQDCSYSDVCRFLQHPHTITRYDQEAKVPYAYNDREWISYENAESARAKATWIRENRFGGAMLFSLNTDNRYLDCSERVFAIHLAVRDVFLS
uniref:Acidic mammalian chitinase n=1 Tax=Sarcoptes scabiei TaxID=52283 RepID=A0A834R1J3_SARSC